MRDFVHIKKTIFYEKVLLLMNPFSGWLLRFNKKEKTASTYVIQVKRFYLFFIAKNFNDFHYHPENHTMKKTLACVLLKDLRDFLCHYSEKEMTIRTVNVVLAALDQFKKFLSQLLSAYAFSSAPQQIFSHEGLSHLQLDSHHTLAHQISHNDQYLKKGIAHNDSLNQKGHHQDDHNQRTLHKNDPKDNYQDDQDDQNLHHKMAHHHAADAEYPLSSADFSPRRTL
jgi:hypothetical protein